VTTNGPRAPKSLGAAGSRLWRQTVADWDLSEDSLTLLRQACHVADACELLQERAAAEPPVIPTRLGGVQANPVHVELRSERRMLLALLLALREPVADGEYPPLRAVR
jgi:hypothetical protein